MALGLRYRRLFSFGSASLTRTLARFRIQPWRARTVGWTVAACVIALITLKLALVADLTLIAQYAPHDDSLYVTRAYYLLRGEAFGPYNSHVLVKNPGLSFVIAGMRAVDV